MYSEIAGELTQSKQVPDWWESQPLELPLFNNEKASVTFQGLGTEFSMEDADKTLADFLSLTHEYKIKLSGLVYKSYMDFMAEIGDNDDFESLKIADIEEVWNFIQPNGVAVERRPYNDMDIYIAVGCNCEWEQEHGLQLVFRQGKKLTRISGIDGHLTDADAYDIPDAEDELLSRF
jgi:hypothetical protein